MSRKEDAFVRLTGKIISGALPNTLKDVMLADDGERLSSVACVSNFPMHEVRVSRLRATHGHGADPGNEVALTSEWDCGPISLQTLGRVLGQSLLKRLGLNYLCRQK
jgi:hypothetical protein